MLNRTSLEFVLLCLSLKEFTRDVNELQKNKLIKKNIMIYISAFHS